MKITLSLILFAVINLCFLSVQNLNAQTDSKKPNKSMSTSKQNLFNKFDPSEKFRFGKVNPAAPKETNQFQFMVGEFVCDDELLVNGTWKKSKATWTTEYILNGYGIKDTYRNDSYAGTSIRFYNTKKKKWDVYFFGMPGEHTGLWEGQKEDGKMVMRQKRKNSKGEDIESRLTFYDIAENSFEWKGEEITIKTGETKITWKISAKRK